MLYAFFWVIPGVWILYADVSEHCHFHLHRRCRSFSNNRICLSVSSQER